MFHRHFEDCVRHGRDRGFGSGPFGWGRRGGGFGPREGRMFDGGELKLVILALAAEKPRHGYEIEALVARLDEALNLDQTHAVAVVGAGSLGRALIAFLEAQAEVLKMREDIRRFLADWLPAYVRDNRSYLTLAIGCTGGQHRSVAIAEWLAGQFRDQARVLVRHRSLAA